MSTRHTRARFPIPPVATSSPVIETESYKLQVTSYKLQVTSCKVPPVATSSPETSMPLTSSPTFASQLIRYKLYTISYKLRCRLEGLADLRPVERGKLTRLPRSRRDRARDRGEIAARSRRDRARDRGEIAARSRRDCARDRGEIAPACHSRLWVLFCSSW